MLKTTVYQNINENIMKLTKQIKNNPTNMFSNKI